MCDVAHGSPKIFVYKSGKQVYTGEHTRGGAHSAMAYTLAITTVKGGVGKTTIAQNLAGALAEMGQKTLLVDLDQQGNLSSVFLNNIYRLPLTLYDLITDPDIPTREVIHCTSFGNIDILPANLELSRVEFQLAGDNDAQFYVADKLKEADDYDLIILDTPPNSGLMTISALVAANGVMIPVECQEWAARGSAYVLDLINKVKRRANPLLRLLGYVINRYDRRRKLEESYREALLENHGPLVFQTMIRNSVKYPEAVSIRRPITAYQPKSEQAQTFRALAAELLQRAFAQAQTAAKGGKHVQARKI
jgi:chromosome partitioning protein